LTGSLTCFPAEEKEMVRAMLSESLQAVISQTLCKTKDGQGRVAAHEIMLGTSAIRNLIREAKVAQMYSSIQTGNSVGMQDAGPEPDRSGQAQCDQCGRGAQSKPRFRKISPASGLSGHEPSFEKEVLTWSAIKPRNLSTTCSS
jgi:hypothetical protein